MKSTNRNSSPPKKVVDRSHRVWFILYPTHTDEMVYSYRGERHNDGVPYMDGVTISVFLNLHD